MREILRAALAQARYMQVPVSAAVNEAVKLTRTFKKASTGCGFRCGRLIVLIPLSLRDIPLFKGDKMNNNKPTLKRFS